MPMSDLTKKRCQPCEGGIPALTKEQVAPFMLETPLWFADEKFTTIARTFELGDFQDAIVLVNKIAKVAESERHHPNLFVHNYNRLTVSLSTHAVRGLTENDFILAAKIDKLL